MDIREVAFDAVNQTLQAWKAEGGVGVPARRIADAVAVAVLREAGTEVEAALNELRSPLGRKDYAIRYLEGVMKMLAAFTPAEPPQRETKVLRAPTTDAETVADPRDDFPGYPDAVQRAYMDQLDWNK